jgi:hypothetical protein
MICRTRFGVRLRSAASSSMMKSRQPFGLFHLMSGRFVLASLAWIMREA